MAYYFRIPLFVMNTLFEMRFDFQVKSPLAAVNQFRTSNANPIAVIILYDTRFHSVFCDGRVHEVYPVESSSGVGHHQLRCYRDVKYMMVEFGPKSAKS